MPTVLLIEDDVESRKRVARLFIRHGWDVIEALEGTSPGHFVLAVQWHPERTYDDDAASRALFKAFISAARNVS